MIYNFNIDISTGLFTRKYIIHIDISYELPRLGEKDD